jgi:hypothetical protein
MIYIKIEENQNDYLSSIMDGLNLTGILEHNIYVILKIISKECLISSISHSLFINVGYILNFSGGASVTLPLISSYYEID